MSMPAPVSSPRMVGRRAELAALLEAFDEGRRGTPRTVIVRGEAGIGKTRLVQEFLAAAATPRDDGPPLVVAIGQCVDLGPIGAPFGPVRRVLRELHDAVGAPALRDAAGSPGLVATLAALVPGIAGAEPAGTTQAAEFAVAIEVVLEALSAQHHVVIVIEDLQWADAATMGLLKALAGTLRGAHLTIVATYRSDDIDRFHPLRPVLAELERTRSIVRIEVGRLSVPEVTEQIGQLTGGGLPGHDADVLAVRSGGIPFLVEELVDIGGGPMPETLRELVLARYARLTPPTQEVVRTMAAGGIRTDHSLLRAVCERGDGELDAALREAIDARAVITDGDGYAFRHALTQEAVQGEMLPSERVRVHRRYAQQLAAMADSTPETISAIAEHWLAARDLPAAFDATVAELAQSRATYSPATSAKLAERLTELWDQVPDPESRAESSLAELHLEAAQAWHDLGEPERSLRSANEGLQACDDDRLTRAALLRQRFVEQHNFEHAGSRDDLLAAAALLEGDDDPRAKTLRSRILSNIAVDSLDEDPIEVLQQAIALAEEVQDDAALAVALTIESWRIADQEKDEEAALVPLERAAGLRLDPALRSYAGSAQVDMLVKLGRYDEAIEVGERLYADTVHAGIERGGGGSIALTVASALLASGRAEEGLQRIYRARQLMAERRGAAGIRVLATHYTWNDQPDVRDDLVAAEAEAIAAADFHPRKHGGWAIEQGDAAVTAPGLAPDDAGAARDAAIEAILPSLESDRSIGIRRSAALTAAMLLAAGAQGDAARAARAAIDADLPRWPAHGVSPTAAAYVRALLGDVDGAPAADRVAAWRTLAERLADGILPVWYRHDARLRLAAALIDAGERAEAAELLDDIARTAPGDGVARVGRWAAELAVRAGLGGGRSDGAIGSDAIVTLTPRELQVLELVAEGLTNPQIGQRLYISPKTASVHVSAILAKVGAVNRTEAAAFYSAHRAAVPAE